MNGMYYQQSMPGYLTPEQILLLQQQQQQLKVQSQYGVFEQNDDDSMLQQMEDAQRMMYMQEQQQMQEFQSMQQMQRLHESQRMALMQHPQLQHPQLQQEHPQLQQEHPQLQQDLQEISQVQQFEQMQHRLHNQYESNRILQLQNQYAEELEPIDQPIFEKRALPKHSASSRSVYNRLEEAGRRRHKHRKHRSKSLGRLNEDRDDMSFRTRRKSQTKRSSSVRPKRPERRRISRKASSEDASVSSGNDSDASKVSDGSWNAAPSPLEIFSGMIEGINSTLQKITTKASSDDSESSDDESEDTCDSYDS
jgi:hypothetical protein